MKDVYDASNNLMKFLGLVRVNVTIHGGKSSDVTFHISDMGSDEVLIGMNAKNTVTISERAIIPPFGVRLVTARCSIAEERIEGVLWSMREDISNGVLRITNNEITVPIINKSDRAMIVNKGDEIGEMGKEKWLTKWMTVPCWIREAWK